MNDREKQILRSKALEDQAWRAWQECLPDIERIAEHGPSPGDESIIIGVCALAAGKLRQLRGEASGA